MDTTIPTTTRRKHYMGAKLMTNELTTELQFNVDFKASKITIQNEAQLAEMVESAVKHYSTMIFTDENIPEAKKARADLNKVVTLLDDQRKYARAWLDGYEVEEDPLYYVKLPGVGYLNNADGGIKHTDKEIKAIDERYWPFAVKVDGE